MAGIGTLARLSADTVMLRDRMELLTRQVSTGRRAEAPGDLVRQLPRSLDLRAEIGRRDAYGEAITSALTRSAAGQGALQRLAGIAREFADDVTLKLDPNDPDRINFAATRAKAALVEVGELLNTRANGEYLFGGTDFQNPPIPDPAGLPNGGLASAIAAAVAGLGGGNAGAVAAATRAAALDDTPGATPFSEFVTDPSRGGGEARRSVPSADGTATAVGLFAARNAAATSTGETTGSWARDVLRGLASVAALTPPSSADAGNFQDFAATLRAGLSSAADALADEQGALGLTEARLEAQQRRHTEMRDSLETQLAGIEDADLAEVLTRLQSTRAALEASYSAIGRLGNLTLTAFLR